MISFGAVLIVPAVLFVPEHVRPPAHRQARGKRSEQFIILIGQSEEDLRLRLLAVDQNRQQHSQLHPPPSARYKSTTATRSWSRNWARESCTVKRLRCASSTCR